MPLSQSLAQDFPEYKDAIHELKTQDQHFATLFQEYDEVVHALHRIEQGVETPSDAFVETLKKRRLALKDAMCGMIQRLQGA